MYASKSALFCPSSEQEETKQESLLFFLQMLLNLVAEILFASNRVTSGKIIRKNASTTKVA